MPARKSFWEYFWVVKIFLQAAGILPFGGSPSLWKSSLSKVLAIAPLFYGSYLVIPQMNYILFRRHTMDDLLEAVSIVVTIIAGQIRSFFVAIYRRKIARLFDICAELRDHATPADFKVISTWAKRAKLFSMTYFCAANFSITAFVLTTTVKQLSSPANSTTRYYPFQYPEDSTPSPRYEIKYTLQVIIGYLGNSWIATADIIGTLLALSMCGQVALIRSWLLDISEEKLNTTKLQNDESIEAELKKCIRRHQVVLTFCTDLEEVVQYINLTQMIAGMYVLAISGARLLEVKMYCYIQSVQRDPSFESNRYLGPFLLSISGIFFSCWPADSLSLASSELAQAVYEVPWYRCSSRGKTSVAIMLARSQSPAQLTAGKFVAMSLETFSSIISASLSFCMVLYKF